MEMFANHSKTYESVYLFQVQPLLSKRYVLESMPLLQPRSHKRVNEEWYLAAVYLQKWNGYLIA